MIRDPHVVVVTHQELVVLPVRPPQLEARNLRQKHLSTDMTPQVENFTPDFKVQTGELKILTVCDKQVSCLDARVPHHSSVQVSKVQGILDKEHSACIYILWDISCAKINCCHLYAVRLFRMMLQPWKLVQHL